MKIIKIRKDVCTDWISSGYRVTREGCGCCENDYDGFSVSDSDLDKYTEWLAEQMRITADLRYNRIKNKEKSFPDKCPKCGAINTVKEEGK